MISFTLLKAKIASAPILSHFDPDQPPVIVVYASKWAVSAALLQNHDGVVKCSCKNEHFTLGPTATVNHPDPVDLDRQNWTGLAVNRFHSRRWLADGRPSRFKLTG